MTEYEEIAKRLEDSLKLLELVNDALASKENIRKLKDRVDQECDQMTLRVQLSSLHQT